VTGRIADAGIRDISQMGAAMAPAAYETISAFFKDTGSAPDDLDLIVTGDLGRIGRQIVAELFQGDGIELGARYNDCGVMIYDLDRQRDIGSGGSGCGCSAAVLCGHILNGMSEGLWSSVLFCGTGALMSPTSSAQGESILGICHAVRISNQKWA
jgi:stage V sporulation protein AD